MFSHACKQACVHACILHSMIFQFRQKVVNILLSQYYHYLDISRAIRLDRAQIIEIIIPRIQDKDWDLLNRNRRWNLCSRNALYLKLFFVDFRSVQNLKVSFKRNNTDHNHNDLFFIESTRWHVFVSRKSL